MCHMTDDRSKSNDCFDEKSSQNQTSKTHITQPARLRNQAQHESADPVWLWRYISQVMCN